MPNIAFYHCKSLKLGIAAVLANFIEYPYVSYQLARHGIHDPKDFPMYAKQREFQGTELVHFELDIEACLGVTCFMQVFLEGLVLISGQPKLH